MICRNCRETLEAGARFCTACGLPVAAPVKLGRGSALALDDWASVVLGEPLGQGGMGIVHRAQLEYTAAGRLAGTPGHPVAVKVLRSELHSSARARQLFQREAAALGRLAHPNIVRFIALYEADGNEAIVMEFVQGSPLSHVIHAADKARTPAQAPCIAVEQAWHYFAQLLGALAAVHTIGILHRDVKPGNLLIRPDGVAKLTDFGIARLPESGPGATGGIIAGTGAYMSPEQVRGDELDVRSDLYAAAIVFYEMLAGVTPFDRPERDELMVRTAQLDEAPRALGETLVGLPPELDLVMAHALAKDRGHRFATAVELGDAVRRALRIEPGRAWAAQRDFAQIARTISQPVPQAGPELIERAERLRTAMMTPLDG